MNIRFYENCIALQTMLFREASRVARIWQQTLLPPIVTTSLYFIIFGNLIGERIGDMQGESYIHYIIPGLVMMAIIINSYANVVSSFFGSKFQRNIEEMLVSPMPNIVMLWGFISGGIFRGTLIGILVTIVAKCFDNFIIYSLPITILIGLLTSLLFTLAGVLNAIYAKKFDDISLIPTFVLTPLTYLGGVFYSIDLLSPFWQKVTLFNPIFYMVNGFRYGMLGKSDIPIINSIFMIIIFIIILHTICMYLINRGVGLKN